MDKAEKMINSDPMSQLTFDGRTRAAIELESSMTKRRRHTAEYKLRILKETDLCRGQPGAVAALLRKEGLYASVLSVWRKQRDTGALSAMSGKRGRKPKGIPQDLEIQQLRKEKGRLEEKLRQAELIIDLQKKVAAILGAPIAQSEVN
jgi:transposase-like protein